MPRVLVVGDVITDIAVRLREPVVWGTDTRSRIETRSGGSAANAAAWLAVAGAQVTLVARVGNDPFADFHRRQLEEVGVEPHFCADPALPTGSIVVLVTTDGDRTMLTDRGANLHLTATDIPGDLFQRHDALYITGYSFFEPGVRAAALYALSEARREGMTVAVDPSSDPLLAEVGAEQFFSWTGGADYLFPNRAEAKVLSGKSEPEAMARCLAERYGEVALTLGADGALWWSGGEDPVRVPAAPAEVIDTTGAGDAFAAGFLVARMSGKAPQEALAAGAALAGSVVTRIGARPAIDTPRRRDP